MSKKIANNVEWEALLEPFVIELLHFPSVFFPGTARVEIRRDEEMRLALIATGAIRDHAALEAYRAENRQIPVGELRSTPSVSFDAGGVECEINAIFDAEWSSSASATTSWLDNFTQRGPVFRLQRRWKKKWVFPPDKSFPDLAPLGAPVRRVDWFINGPKDHLYGRATERTYYSNFRRKRDFCAVNLHGRPGGGSSYDHFVVETDSFKFAVGKVPEGLAPAWSNPISIEYYDALPSVEERKAVEEIVSFVLGRRLLRVGSTLFDDTDASIEDESVNPWGDGVRSLCQKIDCHPIPISISDDEDVEIVIGQLLPKYLELREVFNLSDALWTYWFANEAPIGANLGLYSAAVEALKKSWFKSTKSKSQGMYLSKEVWLNTVDDLVAAVGERLEDHPSKSAMLNRVKNANQMGANEQMVAFFKEIGLPVGKLENDAMRARNSSAHGGYSSNADHYELIRHGDRYRTLFERTFLKLLGYEGTYIDSTTLGYPKRPLSEPAGGA